MWVMPDFDDLNVQLKGLGLDEFSNSGMVTWGGGGYVYVMFIDNLRIGGMGFGGSTSSDAIIGDFKHEAEYSLGGGAFTIEYSLPFVKGFAVSPGLMIGGGSVTVDLYKNKGNYGWDGIWQEQDGGSENITRRMKSGYFTISPTLNVDIPINRFMAFRAGAGYLITIGDEWEVDNGVELSGVPSSLNSDVFFIQTGIFIGFFTF